MSKILAFAFGGGVATAACVATFLPRTASDPVVSGCNRLADKEVHEVAVDSVDCISAPTFPVCRELLQKTREKAFNVCMKENE